MKKGGVGGGNTRTGLVFEGKCDLRTALASNPRINIINDDVFVDGERRATLYQKGKLYTNLLVPKKVNYKDIISKRLLPDDAILSHGSNVLTIVEKKFQCVPGSVDEKLQTCDFKNKQYHKLFAPLGISVQYVYVLNDWFKDGSYKDVLDYIESVGCSYFFNELPLEFLKID
jgi:hypothetical protein